MLEQKTEWIGTRFGDIDEGILGQIKEVGDIFHRVRPRRYHNPVVRFQSLINGKRQIVQIAHRIAAGALIAELIRGHIGNFIFARQLRDHILNLIRARFIGLQIRWVSVVRLTRNRSARSDHEDVRQL